MPGPKPTLSCPCEGEHLAEAFNYTTPPEGETLFEFGSVYERTYLRCDLCGHWFARHDMDMSALYSGQYVDAKYGDRMRATYDRIMALPPERSDNVARVRRVDQFARVHLPTRSSAYRVLDVGSGLAVFPARMHEAGWDCTAVDPDPAASEHARTVAGVEAIMGDFRELDLARIGRFDLVTFNKVLEHVEDPVDMLSAAKRLVEPHGLAYVEVPDVAAAQDGPDREEFMIEHHHVFSATSLALLAERAGWAVLRLDRIVEASGKYTLYSFMRLAT